MPRYYFYIAKCLDQTLYIGSTTNVTKRIRRHNLGYGSQWIKQHGKAEIVYLEEYELYQQAHKRELQVKRWSRQKKENLITGLWRKKNP